MSLDEHEPPVDHMSRVEDRERLLAAALAHAEAQEAQYRLPATGDPVGRRWKTPTALAVFALAALLAAFPPAIAQGPDPLRLEIGDRERGARAAVYIQIQQIEVFRVREGRLPRSLDEVPGRVEGVRFVRSNNRVYQLVGRRPLGGSLIYDSARPAQGIGAIADAWFEGEGPSP